MVRPASWAAFVRLWLLLLFSYDLLTLLFDLAVFGYIDLRSAALVQLVALPLGQAAIVWVVTRRGRAGAPNG
jgi:hypothetical protein